MKAAAGESFDQSGSIWVESFTDAGTTSKCVDARVIAERDETTAWWSIEDHDADGDPSKGNKGARRSASLCASIVAVRFSPSRSHL